MSRHIMHIQDIFRNFNEKDALLTEEVTRYEQHTVPLPKLTPPPITSILSAQTE
jgi:hypothetical protein